VNGPRETTPPAANDEPAQVGEPDERDRELLDYLIERAWEEWLRTLSHEPTNDNQHEKKRAA